MMTAGVTRPARRGPGPVTVTVTVRVTGMPVTDHSGPRPGIGPAAARLEPPRLLGSTASPALRVIRCHHAGAPPGSRGRRAAGGRGEQRLAPLGGPAACWPRPSVARAVARMRAGSGPARSSLASAAAAAAENRPAGRRRERRPPPLVRRRLASSVACAVAAVTSARTAAVIQP
jgi:hypothetical protein